MRIAISTPTGKIGNKLTRLLLQKGEDDLVLLARKPEKLVDEKALGAKVHKSDLKNKESLVEPLMDADIFFFLIPPFNTEGEERGIYRQIVANVMYAIEKSALSRVVLLSSLGAQHAEGTGAILGLHDAEQALSGIGIDTAFLRVGYLMENCFWVIDSIVKKGVVELPISGSAEMSFLATTDIARIAADLLTDTSWKGKHIKELLGPVMTFDEVASIIGQECERVVRHVQQSVADVMAEVEAGNLGFHPDYLPEHIEVFECMEKEMAVPEFLGSAEIVMETTFAEFARQEIAPHFSSSVTH